MAGQPITAAPWVETTYGLGSAVGAGVTLLDNGTDPLDPGSRWRASQGFSLEDMSCSWPDWRDDICLPTTVDPTTFPPLYDYEPGFPFVLGAGVRCSTVGSPDLPAFYAAADRQLQLTQWNQIAYELMTGTQSTAAGRPGRSLATATALPAAANPIVAIATLEGTFAKNYIAGPHLIHAPPQAVAYLKAENLITGQGGRWYTALGSLVVTDDAYAIPFTAQAATVTLWGTGPITVRLDRQALHPEPELVDAVTVKTNDMIVRSQKLAAVAFMCAAYSIATTLVDP